MTSNTGQGDQKPALATAMLPQNTPQVIGDTARSLKKCTRREIRHGNEGSYILATQVPAKLVDPSADDHCRVFGSKCRVTYDAETRQLIAQIPCGPHLVAAGAFGQEIMMQSIKMGAHARLIPMGKTTHIDGTVQKEPAACFRPKFTLLSGRTAKWPTLVVECCWSESLAHIQWDANLWIGRSEAEVKVVILMSMTKDQDALVVEKWTPGNPPQTRSWTRFSASREQSVRIFRYANGTVKTAGHPLIIRFEEVFLRPPKPPLEQDFELDQAALISIAECAWDRSI
ncbi:hypothetical protein BDV38DRAFT_293436 [Aspergillus pseudotamarii]|uniref:Uncharacterized protein n=1 Tax=Aspergillus pseudotamarii TaxID=132259 RepID=A0A5N6T9A6_ASPPS|nr:uncharacterized protein BDV38DRAFT_293436 [Aspergillus pseudotamarii]KAE8142954.1 hypothetical protein BDV38DRAFT_293436 [Aspergillus pseudotamarii]